VATKPSELTVDDFIFGAVPANIEICYVGWHEKEQIKQTHSV
jgi:hypothetical protein